MEYFAKKKDTDEFHPLNYQQLKIAQDKDKTIQKNPKNAKNTIFSQGFPWGRKNNLTYLFQREDCDPRSTSKACY
jgi:hypothetical protein